MKKFVILAIAMLFLLSACTDAPKEEVSQKEETSKKVVEEKKDEPTLEKTPEPTTEPTPTPAPLPMKVAVVVARDSYASGEFNPVMNALNAAGYKTVVVSDELGNANSFGETTEVEAVFSDLSSSDLRGIVLIGGSDSLWENTELHALLVDCQERERVTAAICLASVTLAKAGVIGEGDTACWFNCDIADPEMKAAGVLDSGQPVTANGLIVTGDGPDSAEEFASEVVNALNGM